MPIWLVYYACVPGFIHPVIPCPKHDFKEGIRSSIVHSSTSTSVRAINIISLENKHSGVKKYPNITGDCPA